MPDVYEQLLSYYGQRLFRAGRAPYVGIKFSTRDRGETFVRRGFVSRVVCGNDQPLSDLRPAHMNRFRAVSWCPSLL